MPDWKFPAILISVMLVGIALTYLQQRAYARELNRLLSVHIGEHLMLVSGRGRTWRGGAIVILVVHRLTAHIVTASRLSGLTVFARFRPVPALLGPAEGAVDRIKGRPTKAAVAMALEQVKPGGPAGLPSNTFRAPLTRRRAQSPANSSTHKKEERKWATPRVS